MTILSVLLGSLVTAAMAVVAWLAWRRWVALDAGGRLIVGSVGLSLATSVVMLAMVLLGRPTRTVLELQVLGNTTLMLLGLARWQPRPGGRRVVYGLLFLAVAVWLVVLVREQWAGPFSAVSAPVAHASKVAAAGLTLVELVRVAPSPWSGHVWFWFTSATMLIDGADVLLYPLWQRAFGVRDDLVLAAYVMTQTAGLLGYALMARGLLPLSGRKPARVRAG